MHVLAQGAQHYMPWGKGEDNAHKDAPDHALPRIAPDEATHADPGEATDISVNVSQCASTHQAHVKLLRPSLALPPAVPHLFRLV